MSDNQSDSTVGAAASDSTDVAAIKAENEALKAQVAAQEQAPPTKGGGWRFVVAWILVVLAVLSVVLSVFALWFKATIANEDRFVDTFGALVEEEAVVNALSVQVAEDIVTAAGVEASLTSNLPPELSFLAAPATQGVEQLTTEVAREIFASDIFAGLWRAALRVSHVAVSTVLETEGEITIDLDEAAQSVVDTLADRGVTALQDVEVDVPEIVVFQNDQIAAASEVIDFIDTIAWVLPILSLILIVAAIWVSTDRRRTVAFLGFGSAFALMLDLVILRIIRANSVGSVEEEITREAGQATWDTTFRFYRGGVWAFIALALIVGTIAWVMGPSDRAEQVRTAWVRMLSRWSGSDADQPPSDFEKWVIKWKAAIQWGAVVLGLLFIFFGPSPTFWTVTLTAFAVLLIFGGVQAIAGPREATPADVAVPDDDGGAPPEEKVGAGTPPPS